MNEAPLEPESRDDATGDALDEALMDQLAARSRAVAEHAYSPYSKVRVGAALLDSEGRVHVGCNVENASYGATICAERAALTAAVAAGARQFVALSLWASPKARLLPCGVCRQCLYEFAPLLTLDVASSGAEKKRYQLAALLPGGVTKDDLV